MTRSQTCQRGFTLIETVLTLSITAVLLVIVFSALRLGISSWGRSEAILERASFKRNAIYRLEREAASAFPYLLKDQEDKLAFFGSEKSVGFLTVASTLSTIPGPRWVYFVSDREGLKVYEKYLTEDNYQSFEGWELVEAELEIKEVSFEYIGKDGRSSVWEPVKEGFPKALRAQILTRDDERLSITILIGAGYGQVATPPGKN